MTMGTCSSSAEGMRRVVAETSTVTLSSRLPSVFTDHEMVTSRPRNFAGTVQTTFMRVYSCPETQGTAHVCDWLMPVMV